MAKIKIKLPKLYPKQHAAIYDPERISWIIGSTKSGKTIGCLVWIFQKTLEGEQGSHHWWVAPVSSQSKIAFDRMKEEFTRKLPKELYTINRTEKSIDFKGAGKVWFKSADRPDSLYGEDVSSAVIDEASRVKSSSFDAVRSTVTATGGPIRVIGNVKGKSNWFWHGYSAAKAGKKNNAAHKITAIDAVEAGVFSQEELDDAKSTFESQGRLHVYKELYLCEPADDGGNPFGLSSIEACTVENLNKDTVISSKPPEVWGIDLAKSVDWTVLVALDEDGDVCVFERWQKVSWGETKRRILDTVDNEPALIDSSGVGDPVVEALQKTRPGVFEGFKFSSPSKQNLMEGLEIAIGSKSIRFGEGILKDELESFEFEHKRTHTLYRAPSGLHDDAVMALSLAVKHYNRKSPPSFEVLI